MTRRERMETAWSYKEPDRVPIEMRIYPPARELPGAEKLIEFEENEADNFCGAAGFSFGFLGLDSEYSEEVIEDVQGDFKRIRRTHETSEGMFTAITRHNYDEADPNDYHWEKRFIHTLDDFARIAEADRNIRPFDLEAYNKGCQDIGDRGIPCTAVLHPLGTLVRNSNMEEVYGWFLTEEKLTHTFLENCNNMVADSVMTLKDKDLAYRPTFLTWALEMLTPPWFGKYHFEKLVFPYDKYVNDAIHAIGGRHRAHCHGNSGGFLELFANMGIDALEPLEPPPYGDNCIADAKKRVGGRMLLSGNVPSQSFHLADFRPENVREMVRQAIREGAPGGGFTLRTTGGCAGLGKTREQSINSIACNVALVEAAMEFAPY